MRLQAIVFGLVIAAMAPHALADEWTVAENNRIVQIYVGRTTPKGTELVFELASMHFYSNQRLYGCIFVNGQIADIKEYNNEDSYVRAMVKLPADGELVAYSGVVKVPERIDPHDHAALWRAFVNSPHKPFKARRKDLPQWYVINPIKARKTQGTQQVQSQPHQTGGYPYLKPEERAAKAREALDPLTGDKARYYAVWGLAISGYCRESAEALAVIAANRTRKEALRECAAMGLINFTQVMPVDVRGVLQKKLCGALDAEKEKLQSGVIQTLVAWGKADRVRNVLGEKLRDHPMEVIVLKRISAREDAVSRLWEIYRSAPPAQSGNIALSRRWHTGGALIHWQDKRGIDILIECMAADPPPMAEESSPAAKQSEVASWRQSRHNTFMHIASALGRNFGYSGNKWDPALNEAISKMIAWWKANRETWSFEETTSTVVPKVEPGKVLTRRQARLLAARLANDAFARRAFTQPNGKPIGKIEIAPEAFHYVQQKDGRWVLIQTGSAGPEAFVDFALDGTDANVTVNYAWD
ncbi:MAG: hypothetical protein AMS16_06870 [Planctomycetes bacterium DG_58]|nr:MAG: hypothetical protein AMS16_06870 [Planctomycetes bacterium DG_58]